MFREVDGSPEVGDFIVYDEVPDSYCLTAGKPYEVIETDYHGEDYVLIEDDDNEEYKAINDGFTVLKRASQAEALRYLLDKRKAEVAELEEKLEEASRLKWAKLGREVNEYKPGDIVWYAEKSRPTNAIYIDGFSGIFAEVDYSLIGDVHLVRPHFVKHANDTFAKFDEVTLVVPVEHRVDR
ncbi:hypothetical protein P7H16_26710 [Paenibacillus larvae]|nr:hypothetical protein [Paenibacillus larvae]MDT2249808.1 hypothetical protein [Paenibacillus larvae]